MGPATATGPVRYLAPVPLPGPGSWLRIALRALYLGTGLGRPRAREPGTGPGTGAPVGGWGGDFPRSSYRVQAPTRASSAGRGWVQVGDHGISLDHDYVDLVTDT
jgi:hypothetical protein